MCIFIKYVYIILNCNMNIHDKYLIAFLITLHLIVPNIRTVISLNDIV